MKYSLKKIIASILVVSMIFCSQGFYTLADSLDIGGETTEKTIVETTIEESTSGEKEESKGIDTNLESIVPSTDEEEPLEYVEEPEEDEESKEFEEEPEEDETPNADESKESESSEEFESSIDSSETDGNSESSENGESSEKSEESQDESSTTNSVEESSIESSSIDESSDESSTTKEKNNSNKTNLVPEEKNEAEDYEEFENLVKQNYELVELLESYGVTVNNSGVINFFKDKELREDGPYLNVKLDDAWYGVSDDFVNLYNPYSSSETLFGATSHTITLNFGIGPALDKSNNYNGTTYGQTGNSWSFSGDDYQLMTSVLPDAPTGEETTLGIHALLPTFANDVWPGYKFDGWIKEGDTTASTRFDYVMQPYDVTYNAKWSVDPTTINLTIKYLRNRGGDISELFTTFSVEEQSGDYLYKPVKEIKGYILQSTQVKLTESGTDVGEDGLKTINAYGGENFIVVDAETDMKFTTAKDIDGVIPNHDLIVEYYYEPDPTQKSSFIRHYVDTNGIDIVGASSDSDQKTAEEEVECYPRTDIAGYTYTRAAVGTTTSASDGSYPIGKYTLAGQIITDDDVNANNGHFKALMPNQQVDIYYYYTLDGGSTTLKIETKKQKLLDTDAVEWEISTVSVVKAVGSTLHSITYDNLENQGYGEPTYGFVNVSQPTRSYPGGIDGPNGTMTFKLETLETALIQFIYTFDYDSDYWTHVTYEALTPAEGGKGTIAASAGKRTLLTRYFKRDNYSLAQLTANIDVTPDANYRCVWYKNKSSGKGKSGDPLPTTGASIALTGSDYKMFASFEEDPDRWVDITFEPAENSVLTGATTPLHILKDTTVASQTLPNVTVNTGYHWEGATAGVGGRWLDENGNVLGTTFSATHTYKPDIRANFPGTNDPVKPVVEITYTNAGKGTAHIFGVYSDRKYVLTDRNGKILRVSSATQARSGFANLDQGTTYKLYETKSGYNPVVGNTIGAPGANISEPYLFGIKALHTEPMVTENADGSVKITITGASGIQYALLNDRYGIESDFGTATSWDNLKKGTYYLVVARKSGDNVAANSDDAIRNGKVAYTRINDLSTRKYRLVLFGNNVSAQNAGSEDTTTVAGAKMYMVSPGTEVTIYGDTANNVKTFAVTRNVNLNENISVNRFIMPEQDVVINNVLLKDTETVGTAEVENTIQVYNHDANVSPLNLDTIKTSLNAGNQLPAAINDGCIVKHYVVVNKYATNKTTVQALGNNNGKIAPYEYTVDIQTIVLGQPFPNSNANTVDLTSYLALDKASIGNTDFSGGNCPYNPTDVKEIGLEEFELEIGNAKNISYIKRHKMNITCDVSGLTYDDDFYVADNNKITTADGFAAFATNRLVPSIFDDGATNVAKEYAFKDLTIAGGTTVYDKDTVIVNKAQNLKLNYTLNQDREDKKLELTDEIISATAKYDSLTTEEVKATLLAAINAAKTERAEQKNRTVAQLQIAIETLRAAKEAARDLIPEGTEINVDLEANGGTLNRNTITIIVGDGYTYSDLEAITISRSNYTFVGWYDNDKGTGTKYEPTTIVGLEPPTKLYATWKANAKPKPTPPPGGGGTGGGGGGGGGGGRSGSGFVKETILNDQKVVNEINLGLINYGKNGDGVVPIVGQTVWIDENQDNGKFYLFDQNTNKIELKIGNKTTYEAVANQWVVVNDINNVKSTYRTDAFGNVLSGKYATEDGNVYYLSDVAGDGFGQLLTGWILDPHTNNWYYSNPQTGTLLTGWNTIDGKDYFFIKPVDKATNGLTAPEIQTRQTYGMLITNTQTIDGFTVDINGQRINDKPYLLNTQ